MTPPVLMCNCFTDMEDSATLGSDTSAIPGLREAVPGVLPFSFVSGSALLPLGNQSVKPRGLGQSPSVTVFSDHIPEADRLLFADIGNTPLETASEDPTDSGHCCNSQSSHQLLRQHPRR